MSDWLDTPGDVLAVIGIVSAVFGVLFWIIDTRLSRLLREFKPNGGNSARDQLDRIEKKIDDHLWWHMDRGHP